MNSINTVKYTQQWLTLTASLGVILFIYVIILIIIGLYIDISIPLFIMWLISIATIIISITTIYKIFKDKAYKYLGLSITVFIFSLFIFLLFIAGKYYSFYQVWALHIN